MTGRPSFADFGAAIAARLEKGSQAYGDRSFTRSPVELLGEIKDELADVADWGFVLWCRLHELEQQLAERVAAADLPPGAVTVYLPDNQRQDCDAIGDDAEGTK